MSQNFTEPDNSQRAILHVCSFYWTSAVHARLFEQIYQITGIRQIVVVPVKPKDYRNEVKPVDWGCIHQLVCLDIKTTISSNYRGRKIVKKLFASPVFDTINAYQILWIHAHSAYMDGFSASQLAVHYKTRYCLSFRMTDTDFCFKYRYYATWHMKRLARKAWKILTISTGDVKRVSEKLRINPSNIDCINSGLDDFWIQNSKTEKLPDSAAPTVFLTTGKHKAAYKRVDLTIQSCALATKNLNQSSWKLNVLGMTRDQYNKTYKSSVDNNILEKHVNFLGYIGDRDQLLALMRDANVFVLPSRETFGISFLESVSQCTPIVYLKNYAVDRLFTEEYVGYAADSQSIDSVSSAIASAIKTNQGVLGPFPKNPVHQFSWQNLATRYLQLIEISACENKPETTFKDSSG